MEEYLPVIVFSQISPDMKKETIKAQTVIARSNIQRWLGEGKNLAEILRENGSTEEVWRYFFAEKRQIYEQAVKETDGQVLTYEGKVRLTPWHKRSAGKTRSGEEAFHDEAYPPIFSLTPKASGSTRLQSWEVHKGLLHNQYQKKSEYELDEKGKVSFFKKNRNNQVNIWALIDITDMDRNDVLLLNDKFAEFWINEMTREEKKKDIRFTFVIQVDEINDYLQETFYESGGIFMAKHRSRLPTWQEV